MNPDERAIWEILEHHVGLGRALTAEDISKLIPPELGRIRPRAVREIIRGIVIEGKCPRPVVANTLGGFYLTDDPDTIIRYADMLRSLGLNILQRRKGILETAKRCGIHLEEPEQLEMAL